MNILLVLIVIYGLNWWLLKESTKLGLRTHTNLEETVGVWLLSPLSVWFTAAEYLVAHPKWKSIVEKMFGLKPEAKQEKKDSSESNETTN